jgi:hypothetical protein
LTSNPMTRQLQVQPFFYADLESLILLTYFSRLKRDIL